MTLDPEKLADNVSDHTVDHIGKDAPSWWRQLLEVLTEYEVAGEFKLGLRKRQ